MQLYWEFGFGYMAAPFIYFLLASKLQPKLGRMNWSLYQLVEGAKAKFRTGQVRAAR
eukprot:SAG22_NODE_359_length_11758_cov_4.094254_9_plen_57_part_00